MADETKTESAAEKAAWRQWIGKYKTAIVAAVTAVLGVLAGENGVVDGIKSVLTAIFG